MRSHRTTTVLPRIFCSVAFRCVLFQSFSELYFTVINMFVLWCLYFELILQVCENTTNVHIHAEKARLFHQEPFHISLKLYHNLKVFDTERYTLIWNSRVLFIFVWFVSCCNSGNIIVMNIEGALFKETPRLANAHPKKLIGICPLVCKTIYTLCHRYWLLLLFYYQLLRKDHYFQQVMIILSAFSDVPRASIDMFKEK